MIASGDTWSLPEKQTVCSKNNKYCLKIIPKKLTSQLEYFQDKVDGKENAGADKGVKKNLCRGIFYIRNESGLLRKRWEVNLVNEVSPVDAVVSDVGDYVVTFDNWHGAGYGDDVVAIYDARNGKLIRKLGLSDFLTESDIYELPHSVSSIWWGGTHYVDSRGGQLVLQVTKGKRTYEKDATYFEVHIQLDNGKVLDEVRDRLPTLRFTIKAVDYEPSTNEIASLKDPNECFDVTSARHQSPSELLSRAVIKKVPVYPAAAKAVRATGKVAVEVIVNPDGSVKCARAVSGHVTSSCSGCSC
jgi:hypothetical protein